LQKKLQEEESLYETVEELKTKVTALSNEQRGKAAKKTKQDALLKELLNNIKELENERVSLYESLNRIADAKKADIIFGEWKDLFLQYEALLSAQSLDFKRLNEDRTRLSKEISEKQKEIRKRNCLLEEYEALSYSEELEQEAFLFRQEAEKLYQKSEAEYSKANLSYGRAEASLENVSDKLKKFEGKALPLNEVGQDFDKRILDKNQQILLMESKIKELSYELSNLQKVQSKTEFKLSEFTAVQYTPLVLWENYALQLNSILNQIDQQKKLVFEAEKKVKNSLDKMASIYSANSDIKLAISCMAELLSDTNMRGDKYYTLCEHIDANIHTVYLRISQIDTDLKEFDRTKNDLIRQCLIQGKQMYEGLLQLSYNSKVKVQNKRRQMLKFDIPDAVDENIARNLITAEIDKGTEEIANKLSLDSYAESDIRKIANYTVGSKKLLRKYIGLESIVLRAYKIDQNPDNSGYRTWQQTQVNNSGAEKFVVYFAIILALMAYTRDQYDALGKNNRSVLILDNPFGPISSKHVLEPMFEISRNYKVQMICLSDISKSDIVSCFDLVIRAVIKQFAFSKEQLTHKNSEIVEHGFYKNEQIEMCCIGQEF